MTGVEIVGDLLAIDTAFGAAVPAGNFDYWDLPQGTGLPSVLLTRVSRTERLFLSAQPQNLVADRVQATVRASSAAEREAILATIRDACRHKHPTAQGVSNVAILLDGDGPDFKDDDAAIYIGSTDLRVSFSEPA
jgi:hypothetical protein